MNITFNIGKDGRIDYTGYYFGDDFPEILGCVHDTIKTNLDNGKQPMDISWTYELSVIQESTMNKDKCIQFICNNINDKYNKQ